MPKAATRGTEMMSATVGGSPIATCPVNGDVRGAGSDFLQFRADSHRVFQNVAALFRQHHAADMPREEFGPQFFLEHADWASQRRRSDPQSVGGLTQAAELGDMDQGAELAEFHRDKLAAYLITQKSLRNSKPV